MRAFRRLLAFLIPALILGFSVSTLYKWNYIQHIQHAPDEFNIPHSLNSVDYNNNKIDDSEDILVGAKNYMSKNPVYERLTEYPNGWPSANKGSDGDVVAWAFKNAGYDLQNLINLDIQKNPQAYGNNPQGENIAFRVVDNQRIYLSRYCDSHSTDYNDIKDWQAGDIVFFEKNHVAIVADKVNDHGVRFIIHHFWNYQAGYYQDVLETEAWGKITGHYRITPRVAYPKTENATKKNSIKTVINTDN